MSQTMTASTKADYMSLDDIPLTVNNVRNGFHTQKSKPLDFRKIQLRKLYWGLKDNSEALLAACKKDIGKGAFEAALELDWCTNDCIYVSNQLDTWARDEKAADIPLANALLRPKIRKEPYGLVLIIGTYNFPLTLLICPLIGAIAAGNVAIIKPSENAPTVANVMERVISAALDPSCYRVIQGAVPETALLLEQKWDKIFYTGGATVGTIVAKKAAETLTPYTLELGGRNPAIVTKSANIRIAARRLLWGKIHNAGQVCISQNYTLVEEPVLEAFIAELKGALAEFFPHGTRETDDYGRIINQKQFQRVEDLLASTKGKILLGGETEKDNLYVAPTIILLSSSDDPILKEESFAPLLPLLSFSSLDTAIETANSIHATPLGFYPFGSKAEIAQMMDGVRSGGASINDAFIHGSIQTLPFGGVGDSGQGAYRGKASFDCFSHRRSYTYTPIWAEKLFAVRYPPYAGKLKQLRRMGMQSCNFDRDGKVLRPSLLNWILTLGASDRVGGLRRYVLVIIFALALRRYFG